MTFSYAETLARQAAPTRRDAAGKTGQAAQAMLSDQGKDVTPLVKCLSDALSAGEYVSVGKMTRAERDALYDSL